MIVSLNWLKKYADVKDDADKLAKLIGSRLVEIEEVINIGEKYKDALVVKAVSVEKMPDSDHLSIVMIDDGGVNKSVERTEDNLVQVVCGAPNIATGQTVVWLPPSSIVPETFGTDDPFMLDARKLRGYQSSGMIASARELDLSDEHEGILVLGDQYKPGTKLATVYELDDYLLDIENKSLTHRPDCFGVVGFAREVAAISKVDFNMPEWLKAQELSDQKPSELTVKIEDPKLSDRYTAVIMDNVDVKRQSPAWMQTYLNRVGMRPINVVVDIANYLMLETGQPLHIFDYDEVLKAAGGKKEVTVRSGKKGEKMVLLDDREIELSDQDIIISAGGTPITLAGAMGGKDTEVSENTKRILIESATFNLYNLRGTQMRHGIFSEAITRFTKGQPAELALPVLNRSIELISELTGAKQIGGIVEDYPNQQTKKEVTLPISLANDVLGSEYSSEKVADIMNRVGLEVSESGDNYVVKVPYWRNDVNIPEDVIEEIGRIDGFDNINPTMPGRDFTAVTPTEYDQYRSIVRKTLRMAGLNEILSYSFIHGDTLKKAGQKPENAYKIVNSISPDLQHYRQSLLPSALGFVHPNIKQGYGEFGLFEINKAHQKSDGLNEEKVPVERENVAFVVANKNDQKQAAFYKAKHLVEYLMSALNMHVVYEKMDLDDATYAVFEPARSAVIRHAATGSAIGVVGEFKKAVRQSFKLPEYCAGVEMDNMKLFTLQENCKKAYRSISKFPSSERDICVQVVEDVEYGAVYDCVKNVLKDVDLETNFRPIDIYKGEGQSVRNITFRIRMTSHERTLASDDVNQVVDKITDKLVSVLSAKIV